MVQPSSSYAFGISVTVEEQVVWSSMDPLLSLSLRLVSSVVLSSSVLCRYMVLARFFLPSSR